MSDQPHYERRAFLLIVGAAWGGYAVWARRPANAGSPLRSRARIAAFDAGGAPTGVVEVDVIHKTDSEWRKQLPPDSYSVTRRKDTEFAGTGIYDRFYGDGIYHCICCDTPVFDSKS